MTEEIQETEISEPVILRPSDARITELKKTLEEARDRWQKMEREELTYRELRQIVEDIYRQRKLDYIYARIKPITPADYAFLSDYLGEKAGLVRVAVQTPQSQEASVTEQENVELDEDVAKKPKRKGK